MSTTITNNLIVKQTILREKCTSFFNSIFMQFYGIKFPLKIKNLSSFPCMVFQTAASRKKSGKIKKFI